MKLALAHGSRALAQALGRYTIWLLIAGLSVRLILFFLWFPLWGDESFIAVNFVDRDWLGLTQRLDEKQVAPIGFLWSTFAAYKILGSSELALRLTALLAGSAALPLAYRWARRVAPRGASFVCLALLSISFWEVTLSVTFKPYTYDLFFSTLLLSLACWWRSQPQALGRLACLIVAAPLALTCSNPTIFVAAALGLVLLPRAMRQTWSIRLGFILYGIVAIGAFAANYWFIGKVQVGTDQHENYLFLRYYWRDAFPPESPWAFPWWLLKVHTGRMMAFPAGDHRFGSTATFILFALGIGHLISRRKWELLSLLLAPMALNIVAAVLGRYPYGGCCRLSQHLAPGICLLVGFGIVGLSTALRLTRATIIKRWRYFAYFGVAFCVGQAFFFVARPYHDRDAIFEKKLINEWKSQLGPNDQLVIVHRQEDIFPILRYRLKTEMNRVAWEGQIDFQRAQAPGARVWLVHFVPGTLPDHSKRDLQTVLDGSGKKWTVLADQRWALRPRLPFETIDQMRYRVWVVAPEGNGAQGVILSAQP